MLTVPFSASFCYCLKCCVSVIEGYFFYSALVTVFEPGTFSMIKFYAVGYGIPAFIGNRNSNFFPGQFGFVKKGPMESFLKLFRIINHKIFRKLRAERFWIDFQINLQFDTQLGLTCWNLKKVKKNGEFKENKPHMTRSMTIE